MARSWSRWSSRRASAAIRSSGTSPSRGIPTVQLGEQLRNFVSRHPDGRGHGAVGAPRRRCRLPVSRAAVPRLAEARSKPSPSSSRARSRSPSMTAIVDFQVLDKTADGTRVFAALAPKSRIDDHLKILAEAGLDPAVVDFAPLTTLNVLQLFEGDRPERYAFLHVSGGTRHVRDLPRRSARAPESHRRGGRAAGACARSVRSSGA